MTNEMNSHGGARSGAGRPRSAERVQRDAKLVTRKLREAAAEGFDILADNYPTLMRSAIEAAQGSETKMPNIALLRMLVELMVKLVAGQDDDKSTALEALVGSFMDRVKAKSPDADGPAMDGHDESAAVLPDSEHAARPQAYPNLPGMEPGLKFGSPGQISHWR